jgi:hypothetical protein
MVNLSLIEPYFSAEEGGIMPPKQSGTDVKVSAKSSYTWRSFL